MLATCYVDASFHPTRGASWGVWIRSDLGRIVRFGRCPEYVRNSTAAELAAVFAAISLAVLHWGDHLGLLHVRSDCQTALALAEGSARTKEPGTRRLQNKISALLQERGIELRCTWVRGHQPPATSTAAYLNDCCDKLARGAQGLPERPVSGARG
jgi:hypothetical protein